MVISLFPKPRRKEPSMKKASKRLLLTVLISSLLPLALLSCANNYTTLYEITKDEITYRLEGVDEQPRRICLVKDGYAIKTLDVSPDKSVGNDSGCYGFYVEDANFDGRNDLLIACKKEGELLSYDVYLATEKNSGFERSKALSSLYNVRVSTEYKGVFGFTQTRTSLAGDHYELCDRATKYVWQDGTLYPDVYAELTYYSKLDRYCYSTAVYDLESNSFDPPRDNWLTRAEYEKTDFSFLYYFKLHKPRGRLKSTDRVCPVVFIQEDT